MKRILLCIISLAMVLALCVGCNKNDDTSGSNNNDSGQSSTENNNTAGGGENTGNTDGTDNTGSTDNTDNSNGSEGLGGEGDNSQTPEGAVLNGKALEEYVIVYPAGDSDYNKRAAEYIRDTVKEKTGITLKINKDSAAESPCEIIVGETARALSAELDADTYGLEFSMVAKGTQIALEGDYFIIAAAAYYFVDTYITGDSFDSNVSEEALVALPITEKAENHILLIGDGMGLYQTLLYSYRDADATGLSDGEDSFYGYLFPNRGFARTNSLSGTTDSAASGTALATGYKTINEYIGRDSELNDVMSLTELASSLGKATAVMSTEAVTGATPAAFSAHANNRNDTSDISGDQSALSKKEGTIIRTVGDYYTKSQINMAMKRNIRSVMNQIVDDEDGFFVMYEEAYIDKHCHSNNISSAFQALIRFNQAIGVFMEYAFYNPDTAVIITADHETGSLLPNGNGGLSYGSGGHTSHNVPVFAYGEGMEVFDGRVIENVQIPKTVAHMWGVEDFGDPRSQYEALTK